MQYGILLVMFKRNDSSFHSLVQGFHKLETADGQALTNPPSRTQPNDLLYSWQQRQTSSVTCSRMQWFMCISGDHSNGQCWKRRGLNPIQTVVQAWLAQSSVLLQCVLCAVIKKKFFKHLRKAIKTLPYLELLYLILYVSSYVADMITKSVTGCKNNK